MDDLLALMKGPGGTGAAFAAAIIGLAVYVPKLLNLVKSDRVDGNVLERLLAHEKRMNEMDKTIHSQQIKLTRLQVLIIQMNGLLVSNGVVIPEYMKTEIQELTEGDKQ